MPTVLHLNANSTTGNATSYQTTSFSPLANDLLVTFIQASGTVAAADKLLSSGQALTFTKITSSLHNASANTLYAYVANQLASTVAMNLTFTCTDDAATGSNMVTAGVAGMTLTGLAAILQQPTAANQTTAVTPAITYPVSVSSNNPTVLCIANLTNPATLGPPASWGELADVGYATPASGLEYVSRNNTFNGTLVTWSSASASAWGGIGLELNGSTGSASYAISAIRLPALGV